MTENNEPNTKILLVYIGRRILSDGKEGHAYLRVSDADIQSCVVPSDVLHRHVFATKNTKEMSGTPGTIYRVDAPPGDQVSSIFPDTATYFKMWPDKDKRAEWQISDHAVGMELRLLKEQAKAQRHDDVEECLAPIRAAYQQARGVQRNLILARAVQYITR